MKLILCPHCGDVRALQREKVTCRCVSSWGYYTDDTNTVIGGEAIALGIANSSLARAVRESNTQPAPARTEARRPGLRFEAFVIPMPCDTITEEGMRPCRKQ